MSGHGGILGFIHRMFGREPKYVPPIGNGFEHDDWRVGDLAECVRTGDWYRIADGQPMTGPRFGQILRVAGIGMTGGWHWLAFEGVEQLFTAECFLKIRPNQREACTPAFAQLIRKHSREGVDA